MRAIRMRTIFVGIGDYCDSSIYLPLPYSRFNTDAWKLVSSSIGPIKHQAIQNRPAIMEVIVQNWPTMSVIPTGWAPSHEKVLLKIF